MLNDAARLALGGIEAAEKERRIADLAAQMRHDDERSTAHRKLIAFHNLPHDSSPREIADAMMAYERGWRDFIGTKYGSSRGERWDMTANPPVAFNGSELLHPESVEEKRRPGIIALRDRLRAQFEVAYAKQVGRPIDPRTEKLQALADRPGTAGEGEAARAAIDRVAAGAAA